jgi:hypothetical protein
MLRIGPLKNPISAACSKPSDHKIDLLKEVIVVDVRINGHPHALRAAGVHRLDLGQYQDGAALRPLRPRRAAAGLEPQGHWKTITFVAALRRNGITAPCTIDGQ